MRVKSPKINVKVCQRERMSDESTGFPEPVLWTLLGTLLTAVLGGVSWLCTKKCRNQECEMNSGCCRFHSDSRLRQTIRQEIQKERDTRDSESHVTVLETDTPP